MGLAGPIIGHADLKTWRPGRAALVPYASNSRTQPVVLPPAKAQRAGVRQFMLAIKKGRAARSALIASTMHRGSRQKRDEHNRLG
jgi:hypothetical protein